MSYHLGTEFKGKTISDAEDSRGFHHDLWSFLTEECSQDARDAVVETISQLPVGDDLLTDNAVIGDLIVGIDSIAPDETYFGRKIGTEHTWGFWEIPEMEEVDEDD